MEITKYLVFVLLTFIPNVYSENLNITSPPVTNWGIWGYFEECPDGLAVQGFQLRTQRFLGAFGDDTAVNGLKFFCGDPHNELTPAITSYSGSKGEWGSIYSCFPGYINGWQIRVEAYQGNGDDMATENMRFFCSNEADPNKYIEGDGLNYGRWGEVRRCFTNQRITGLQTQIEDCSTTNDCTALNNIMTQCSDVILEP